MFVVIKHLLESDSHIKKTGVQVYRAPGDVRTRVRTEVDCCERRVAPSILS